MATVAVRTADWDSFLATMPHGKTVAHYATNQPIFMQGAPAESLLFILHGKVKLAVSTTDGKEAIVATLNVGDFFGEGCLAGQALRMATATSVGRCSIAHIDKAVMARRLLDEPEAAKTFIAQLLVRVIRYEADLVDQMFNSSEKRLARTLLLLSHFGKDSTTETVVAGINQEHLAQMVGTTRSRINYFMNRFRKAGHISYKSDACVTVHRSLLSVISSP